MKDSQRKLALYSKVRVIALTGAEIPRDGWKINKREPAIGDVGFLIDILQAEGLPDHYLVETSDDMGTTIWLSEFLIEELEAATVSN
jgi:hypothetical protein